MSQVVVITGASSGIGRATAHRFALRGSRVALVAREVNALEETAAEVRSRGGGALALPCDVSDSEAVEEVARRVDEVWGPPDVWINGAVAGLYSPILDTDAADFRRVVEVTFLGQVHGTLSALRRMVPRGRGSIVLIGSGLGYRGVPLQAAYCSSKFALRGFADSLRSELHHLRSAVRVSMVSPSTVDTPYYLWAKSQMPGRPNPVPPVYDPDSVAAAVVVAVDACEREVCVGWPATLARCASGVAPGLLDRMFGRVGFDLQTRTKTGEVHPTNLWKPVPGMHAVKGDFERTKGSRNREWSPSGSRAWQTLLIAGAAMATVAWLRGKRPV
jgi:NAD(P)-dependent dehydrogenase (short-subunit alcohol dehydrogenase family)